MKEYTQARVSPENEQKLIEVYTNFGWQLETAQEFYNESTEISDVNVTTYGGGFVGGFMKGFTGKDGSVKVNKRTNVTNFVSLRFSREKTMNGYEELVQKESEYFRLLDTPSAKKPVKRTVILAIGIIVLLISVILAIINSTAPAIWELVAIGVFFAVMIPLTVVGWVNFKKKRDAEYCAVIRMSRLLEEASVIVNAQ